MNTFHDLEQLAHINEQGWQLLESFHEDIERLALQGPAGNDIDEVIQYTALCFLLSQLHYRQLKKELEEQP